MKKIQLSQATWFRVDNKEYGPGAVIDIDDTVADSLITAGSAIIVLKEVKGSESKQNDSSGKD